MSAISTSEEKIDQVQNGLPTISVYKLFKRASLPYHIFHYIETTSGSLWNFVEDVQSVTTFTGTLHKYITGKNTNKIHVINKALPAILNGIKLGTSAVKYYKSVKDMTFSYGEYKEKQICNLLDLSYDEEVENYRWTTMDTSLSNINILNWLIHHSNGDFEYINCFKVARPAEDKSKNFDITDNILDTDVFLILFKYKNKKFILRGNVTGIEGFRRVYDNLSLYHENSVEVNTIASDLGDIIIKSYLKSLNIDNHIISIDQYGFSIESKIKIQEDIYQIDTNKLAQDIHNILDHGSRRGWVLLGKQGVGKTSVLRKLENDIGDVYPIITFNSSCWNTESTLSSAFKKVSLFDKAIVVLEDIDAFDIKDKNSIVGTFINEIDSLGNGYVFIVTINDTTLVHSTIINRPGRFDEIIEIPSPNTPQEVEMVVRSRFESLKHKYYPNVQFPEEDLSSIYTEMVKERCTQADIASGIVDKVFIISKDETDIINNFKDLLEIAHKKLMASKNYDFSKLQDIPKENVDIPEAV